MKDFYYSPFPNDVLCNMFYYGKTEDEFRQAAAEAYDLHMSGQLHIRHVEKRYYCVEYLDSDEYPIEREVYARIVEAVKPYLNNILDNPWPFDVEFAEDSVNVELRFDDDYVDKYLDKYDDGPICRVNGTYAEIADLVKEKIESTFVGAL